MDKKRRKNFDMLFNLQDSKQSGGDKNVSHNRKSIVSIIAMPIFRNKTEESKTGLRIVLSFVVQKL